MLVVPAGLLVYVIILTLTTGYIRQSTRNIISKVVLPNSKDDETLINNDADYIFNCANIASIKLVHLLGSGINKKTYLGEYGTGTKVAVKMLSTQHRKKVRGDQLKIFMKEILLLQQLKHRNILKLLGFCIFLHALAFSTATGHCAGNNRPLYILRKFSAWFDTDV